MRLIDKYVPKKISDIVGQPAALSAVKEWLKNPKGHGFLAYGRSGLGKTALAHAIANENGWELVEMNASDFRKEALIRERLINAATQGSIFGLNKLILVDEVDGLAGRSDSGAIKAIQDLLKISKYPVYLSCNDNWAKNVRELKQQVIEVQFKRPRVDTLVKFLENIVGVENLSVKREAILQIAQQRDFRSALLDLEAISLTPNAGLSEFEALGHRDREKSIFDAIQGIFKAKTSDQARSSLNGVNISDFQMLLHWLDENIMREYQGKDLVNAFDELSKADVFMGRIKRRQDWSLLKYVIDSATIGVSQSKTQENHSFVGYMPSKYIRSMAYTRFQRATLNNLLKKIAKHTRTSKKGAQDYLHVLSAIVRRGDEILPFELSNSELKILQTHK